MDLAALIPLVVQASVALAVVALGLEANTEDVFALVRRPAQLLLSLLAMNVIMPIVAVGLASSFDLHPAVKIALVALALSPVPPILPRKQLKAGGSSRYVYGLLVTAGLVAIVFVPVALEVVERVFGVSLQVQPARVAKIVLASILVPLGIGLVVRRVMPAVAERIARPLSLTGTLLLAVSLVAIVVNAWPAMLLLVGNGTLAAFVAFTIVGLIAGHLLGGPDPDDRTVLAFATSTRHPGVALAIASANFPGQRLVVPAVLLFIIAGAIVSIPYAKWFRSR